MNRDIELPDSLQIFQLGAGDVLECIELAARNFEELEGSPERVRTWFENRILHNPWQKAFPGIGVGIRHNKTLIAFRAIFAQPWWINGNETLIAFASNTVVDQAYRGKGLASVMIEENKKFANLSGSTTAGFITQKAYRKLGFNEIGGPDNDFFRTRISYKGSLKKRFGPQLGHIIGKIFDINLFLRTFTYKPKEKFYLSEIKRCEKEFDLLWEQVKLNQVSCFDHSSRYLNWRLFDYPTCPLHLSALRDSSGTLRAYGIWHITQFTGDIKMAVLRDIFYQPSDEVAALGLLYYLINQWRSADISWFNLEVASPPITALFRQLNYEHVPSKGNRYQIFSETPLDPAVLRNWYRSGLDGDYFDLPF
ncbi:GNAT family N-acetyltransferase [Candidatus Methylomicrobium oryzae]|uniref:GNAT family N-acetyltransferase n=1 Tax=Candidatus Methylomicrobium oryzae TaxID=2802053 RepID=UPI0019214711|nr:GNAT family N-acetyltransferase [Methylomicrobium sp. RS1]MBL1264985.1 hypothetical protein [Methylomicrobium sp. RS1]